MKSGGSTKRGPLKGLMQNSRITRPLLIVVAALSILSSVEARDRRDTARRRPTGDIVFYHGKYTETDLLPILFSQRTDYRDAYITVIGYSHPLNTNIRWIDFEAEAQLGIHSGGMKHIEANGFLIARTAPLFGLPFTLAIGEGLSAASRNPDYENKPKGFRFGETTFSFAEAYLIQRNNPDFPLLLASLQLDTIESRRLLNYMMVEAQYRITDAPHSPAVFMRIHHRSGVFGLYCPPDPACGSNYISYGMKWALE
ncbi:hypothetical protein Lepil_2389 [Leptonema illini DSM 21528]|uniref:Uncharacterized protein n=2 Tax=Leptonema illini TaxID=183 RepID=H2CIP9_9LEPT|nr:hypothetical protein Lepil_2389 [Leptonema illini DSM 21528]